jgi:hypothetical protein
MPTGKKIKERVERRKKKNKKPAPKPAPQTQKDKDDIRKERDTENLKKIKGKKPKDPGPGRDKDGKKRTAPLWRDRLRSGYYRLSIPKIELSPSQAKGLEELGRYGKDISDKSSSGGGSGGDVGGQDAPEIKKLRQSGASFGAKYIGAFDEQNTEDAAGRK